MNRRFLIFLGAGTYFTATYITFLGTKVYFKDTPHSLISSPEYQKSLQIISPNISTFYDDSIKYNEILLGITGKRRQLISRAVGNVLEVSAGTGRNVKYYDNKLVNEITFTDTSIDMLKIAHSRATPILKLNTNFQVQDSTNLSFQDNTFDTVIDTFGLCSIQDPVAAIKEMSRVCKSDGKLLFLEHGRSFNSIWKSLINDVLDKTVLDHASKFGCYWNRDLDKILKEGGVEVLEYQRYNLGTTLMVVAKPLKT